MRFAGKKTKRLIAASLLTGSLIFVPEVCEFPFSSVAFTEVKMYMGTAEDYASPIESQEVAKLRAREKAIQRAKEQAGVILQNYSRSINAVLTDDEISTITANTYQMVGEPVYEQAVQKISDTSTVILWKATVSVNIDDNEVRNWLKLSSDQKEEFVTNNRNLQNALAQNDREMQALRERAKNVATEQEQETLRAELNKVDNDFLYNQKIQEGERFAYKLKLDDAVKSYTEAIRLHPESDLAYMYRGSAYTAKVMGLLDKLYIVKGSSQTPKECYDLAMHDFAKALQINPNHSMTYVSRALLHRTLKEYPQMLDDYGKAIQIDHNMYAYGNLSFYYYYTAKNKDLAFDNANKAVELHSNNSYVYSVRGGLYESEGNFHKAMEDYSMAIQCDPNNPDHYRSRGKLFVEQKDYYRAIEDLNKAIQLRPDSEHPYFARGMAYYDMKNYSKAIEDFTKCIQLNPDAPYHYEMRSLAYSAMGDKEKAEADKKKSEELK